MALANIAPGLLQAAARVIREMNSKWLSTPCRSSAAWALAVNSEATIAKIKAYRRVMVHLGLAIIVKIRNFKQDTTWNLPSQCRQSFLRRRDTRRVRNYSGRCDRRMLAEEKLLDRQQEVRRQDSAAAEDVEANG